MIKVLESISTAVLFVIGGLTLESLGIEHNAYFAFYGATFATVYFCIAARSKSITSK